jgi:cinnamyl-alcohol dehydrogenase
VGKNVSGLASGDRVGVGCKCMVNTCRTCESCEDGAENYCSRMVLTYNSRDRDDTERRLLRPGRRRRAVRGPLPRRATGAPLLCAGATVYAPMRRHGLGMPCKHVAVRFGRAFRAAKVTVISTSPGKREEALESLGADAFLLRTDAAGIKAATGTMHGIVSTACAGTAVQPYLALLNPDGKMILLGIPDKPLQVSAFALIGGKSHSSTSLTGKNLVF